MTARHSASRSPGPSGHAGPAAPPGGVLASVGKFFLRFAAAYGALFLLWQPIQGWLMRILASGADTVLALVERPPVITALVARGNIVTAQSYLRGPDLPLASWNGAALHLFAIAPLALMLAVPRGSLAERARRAALAVAPLSFIMLAIVVVQMKAVAETYARQNLGIDVYSAGERAFLDGANRVLILVGMLLFPAFFFLVAYVSTWSAPADGGTGRPRRSAGRAVTFAAVAACLGSWVWLVQPRSRVGPRDETEGIQRVLTLNPSSARAQFIAGFHEERLGHPLEALQAYDAALSLDLDLVDAHFGRGNILLKQEDFDEAARSYEEVLRRDPRHAPARINLGKVFAEKRLYELAITNFNRVLESEPGNPLAHHNLGQVLLGMKKPCEALPHLEQAVRLDRRYYGDPTLNTLLPRLRSDCAGN